MTSPSTLESLLLARLADGLAGITENSAYAEFRRDYFHRPDAFISDCIRWPGSDGPTDYQLAAARLLAERRRVAKKGPRRLGKTADAAMLLLWFGLTRDVDYEWQAPTMAGSWRQIKEYLWPQVRKWAKRINWQRVGREPFTGDELQLTSLRLTTGSAFGIVSDRPELIEGAGGQQVFMLYDEAKSISDAMFDAAEGAMASGGAAEGQEAYSLAISTPGSPRGRFYDIFARKPGLEDWATLTVTLDDAIRAGRVAQEWADKMLALWGGDSPVYKAFVLGEFADADEEGVIPLTWVEAAIDRWYALQEMDKLRAEPLKSIGVDVARFGQDKTVLAPRFGNVITELEEHVKQDTMQTTGHVVGWLRAHSGAVAIVDVNGLGAGVVDRLRELGYRSGRDYVAFNAGEKTTMKDRSKELEFADKRSAMIWRMRELLDPDGGAGIALPPHDGLIGDLTAPGWETQSGGKIKVESKDGVRKRLGRSTDYGDAVCQAFWEEPRGVLLA